MRLIDAEALKKELDEQMNFEENCRDSVFDIIDNAPTVEPRNGKWIYVCCYGDEYPQCSVCGEINDVKTNFCPDCGADMREED